MKRMTPEKAVGYLGIQGDNKLSACPEGMNNCVCSEYQGKFHIDALEIPGAKPIEVIASKLSQLSGYKLEDQKGKLRSFHLYKQAYEVRR